MMKITIQKKGTNYVTLLLGVVRTSNAASILKKLSLMTLPKNAWMALFDTHAVATQTQIYTALQETARLPDNRKIAQSHPHEFLVRLSAQRQLAVALKRFDISNRKNPHIGLLVVARQKAVIAPLVRQLLSDESFRAKPLPRLSNARQQQLCTVYGISPVAIKTLSDRSPASAFESLLQEQIALIELSH